MGILGIFLFKFIISKTILSCASPGWKYQIYNCTGFFNCHGEASSLFTKSTRSLKLIFKYFALVPVFFLHRPVYVFGQAKKLFLHTTNTCNVVFNRLCLNRNSSGVDKRLLLFARDLFIKNIANHFVAKIWKRHQQRHNQSSINERLTRTDTDQLKCIRNFVKNTPPHRIWKGIVELIKKYFLVMI